MAVPEGDDERSEKFDDRRVGEGTPSHLGCGCSAVAGVEVSILRENSYEQYWSIFFSGSFSGFLESFCPVELIHDQLLFRGTKRIKALENFLLGG